jgi:hypothetical protein
MDLVRRRALLIAAIGFMESGEAIVVRRPPMTLARWLEAWSGLGGSSPALRLRVSTSS